MKKTPKKRHLVTSLFHLFFIILSLFISYSFADDSKAKKEPKPQEAKTFVETKDQVTETEHESVEKTERQQNLYPSNYGGVGIFRVRSAESLPKSAITFGIGGEFYAINDAPNVGQTGNDAQSIAESLFIGYSPVENFTMALMRRNSSTTYGVPKRLISSLGDFNFSLQYTFPLGRIFAIAPIGNVLVASNFNNLTPEGNTVSAGIGLAGTLSLYPISGLPLYAHVNAIYHMPQIRNAAPASITQETFFNFSRYDTVNLSLGAELRVGDFVPFVEYFETVEAGSALSFGQEPSRITFGSRFQPFTNKSVSFLLGGEVGLSRPISQSNINVVGVPYTPGYQIIGQLSYTVGLSQTERKHYYTTPNVNVVDRKFILDKNINFKNGSAEMDVESKGLLDQIAEVIQKNNINKLLIVGHTDSSSNEDYNLKLSVDRANAVKKYLVSKGIAEESLMTQGFGKRKPKASNATDEGRAQNRRVEFLIVE